MGGGVSGVFDNVQNLVVFFMAPLRQEVPNLLRALFVEIWKEEDIKLQLEKVSSHIVGERHLLYYNQ